MLRTHKKIRLHLFDGAAAPAGGSGSQAVGQSVADSDGSEDLSKVVYGKEQGQAPSSSNQAMGTQAASPTAEAPVGVDLDHEFESLIGKGGKYKEQFDSHVKQILDRRFKNMNSMQDDLRAADSVLSPLMDIYGVSNLDDLRQKVLMDNNRVEDLADEAGMTKEQYLAYREAQRQNQAYQEAEMARIRQEEADKTYDEWMRQAAELQEEYPGFDLEAECENGTFVTLLRSGVDVRSAYLALHHDDILRGVASEVGEAVRTNTVNTIRARGARPMENGLKEQAGVVRKNDASKLTRADRAEIAKRVQRGETIVF